MLLLHFIPMHTSFFGVAMFSISLDTRWLGDLIRYDVRAGTGRHRRCCGGCCYQDSRRSCCGSVDQYADDLQRHRGRRLGKRSGQRGERRLRGLCCGGGCRNDRPGDREEACTSCRCRDSILAPVGHSGRRRRGENVRLKVYHFRSCYVERQ